MRCNSASTRMPKMRMMPSARSGFAIGISDTTEKWPITLPAPVFSGTPQ